MGLPYGVNNKLGRPNETEAHKILDKAASEQINLLDSAEAYGDALNVIGTYLKKRSASPFKVISKFIGDQELLKNKVERTLTQARQENLYAYLFHRFSDYQSGKYRKELSDLQTSGKIERIGVSVYSQEELEISVADADITVIQIPLNPLDASDEKLRLLALARRMGKEIHVRSVFLQGLFFKHPEELTGNLKDFSKPLKQLEQLARSYHLNIRELCLNFALHQSNVDRVIIGVESVEQLEENLRAVTENIPESLFEDLKSISGVSQPLLNPSTWKP